MATEKPPLYPDVWEEIEAKKYSLKMSWAGILRPFLHDLPSVLDTVSGPPPKQPIALCKNLVNYAINLFDLEAAYYPQNEGLPVWLQNLAGRVERDIIAQATGLGRGPGPGLATKFTVGLTYHASEEEMAEAIRKILKSLVATFKPKPLASTQPNPKPAPPPPVGSSGYVWRPEDKPAPVLPPPTNPQTLPLSPERNTGPALADGKAARVALRESYFAAFEDKIIVLDACWAAGQHYCELKRWLRGPAILKAGSVPDLAFRKLFTSGKLPREHKKQPRPSGWK
jgi:hypothetical protein